MNAISKFITIIRPEFMSFCKDACRSASLNHLLFRIAYKCKDQPKEKIQAGEVLWYAKTELLVEEMSDAWGLCKVRGEVNALVKMNLIGRTGNPNWGVDRTKHFYFGKEQCAVFIKLCEENDICIVHLDLPPEVKHLIYSSNANDTSIKCTCEKQEASDESIECISYNHQMHSIDSSLAFDKSIGTITKNTTKIYNKDNDKEEGTYGDDANAHHATLAFHPEHHFIAFDDLEQPTTMYLYLQPLPDWGNAESVLGYSEAEDKWRDAKAWEVEAYLSSKGIHVEVVVRRERLGQTVEQSPSASYSPDTTGNPLSEQSDAQTKHERLVALLESFRADPEDNEETLRALVEAGIVPASVLTGTDTQNGEDHVLPADRDRDPAHLHTLRVAQAQQQVTPLQETNNNNHSHEERDDNGQHLMAESAGRGMGSRSAAAMQPDRGDSAPSRARTDPRRATRTGSAEPGLHSRGSRGTLHADPPAEPGTRQSDTTPARNKDAGDTSGKGVSHDALAQQQGETEPTTRRLPTNVVGVAQGEGHQLSAASVAPHQGRAQTDATPSPSVENKKAEEQDRKPARTSKKAIVPSGPPQMPSDDAPWNAETVVQIFEARLGRRYPNGAKRAADRVRDKELAASIELVNMVDLWDASTKENKYRLLKIADHHENRKEQWFLDNVGRVMPHHLLKDDYIHRDVDELVRLKKSKQGSAHSVSGRHNYTYEKDLPKEEAPLPYRIVPQQSPRKLDLELKDDEQPRRRLRLHRVTPLAAAPAGM